MTSAESVIQPVTGQMQPPVRELVYHREPTLFAISLGLSVLVWLLVLVGTVGTALIWAAVFYVSYLFAHSALIAHLRGSAVQVTELQFPDIHARVQACCRRLKLKEPPEVFLLHGNGVFNAMATRFRGRYFVVLYSDVVDALADDPDALNFYIGHELGHIRRLHLAFHTLLAPAGLMPLLGAAYSRAREYTCDLHGLACCPRPEAAARGLAALAAGHERWRNLDLDTFAAQADKSGGFWMSFHELLADYPWLAKRMARLRSESPLFPSRSPMAWLLALFIPRTGLGGAGPLVLIAVAGMLAAVSIPAYQDYTVRTRLAEVVNLGQSSGDKVAAYYQKNGSVPASPEEAGIAATVPDKGVTAVAIQNGGVIQYTVSIPPVKEGHLVFSPVRDSTNVLHWRCSSDIATKFLPPACR